MKVTVHEVECCVGYARPIFRGIDPAVIDAEIAKTCREDWAGHNWVPYWDSQKEDREDPPPMPKSDREVIQTYFYGPSGDDDDEDDSDYWVNRTTYELDLSAPEGILVDLTVDGVPFKVVRYNRRFEKSRVIGITAATEGTLIQDAGFTGDALEGFIMALAAAGFPVHVPAFKECLSDYCENLGNRLDEIPTAAELENMERKTDAAGLSCSIDRNLDAWVVSRGEGEEWILVDNQPMRGFETRAEALEFAFELT